MQDPIARNPSVNATILECFGLISNQHVENHYRKRFASERHEEWQVMTTYRELVIGGYFAAKGFETSLGRFDDQTPDWRIERASECAVVEVFTKYVSQCAFQRLEAQEFVYVDDATEISRFVETFSDKVQKYRKLVQAKSMRLIIAAAFDLSFAVEIDALREVIVPRMAEDDARSVVAGCLLYERLNGQHRFDWFANGSEPGVTLPRSERVSDLKSLIPAA